MRFPNVLKLIGALLLLVSITLPMSSCTVGKEPGNTQLSQIPDPNTQNENRKYKYLLKYFDIGDPATWVTLLVFSWPLLSLGILHWKKSGRVTMATRGLEPILIVGSVIWIEFISTFFADRREIGAYLAFCAIGIYAIGAVWSDVAIYRIWKRARHT